MEEPACMTTRHARRPLELLDQQGPRHGEGRHPPCPGPDGMIRIRGAGIIAFEEKSLVPAVAGGVDAAAPAGLVEAIRRERRLSRLGAGDQPLIANVPPSSAPPAPASRPVHPARGLQTRALLQCTKVRRDAVTLRFVIVRGSRFCATARVRTDLQAC